MALGLLCSKRQNTEMSVYIIKTWLLKVICRLRKEFDVGTTVLPCIVSMLID